jgi:hypothetical protein
VRRRALALLALPLLATVAPACGEVGLIQPDCRGEDPDTLVLVAQAVPTAELVPCLGTLPAGWEFEALEVRQDRARIVLDSDRAGDNALTVTLAASCELGEAKRVPSDEAGARRFERIRRLRPYSGARYYQFRGGCVTYDFEFHSERSSALLNEASLMVDFVARSELRDRVVDQSEGVITDAP